MVIDTNFIISEFEKLSTAFQSIVVGTAVMFLTKRKLQKNYLTKKQVEFLLENHRNDTKSVAERTEEFITHQEKRLSDQITNLKSDIDRLTKSFQDFTKEVFRVLVQGKS